MVAAAKNLVRRTERDKQLVDGRRHARVKVCVRAWLCAEGGSARGYCLDLSRTGGRFGGMGVKLAVGQKLIAKLVVDEADAPVVVRAEVVRYAPLAGCPELCVRFLDSELEETFRLAAFLDSVH